jgi:hypothetical protein
MNFPFSDFNVSPNCRTPAPTNYPKNCTHMNHVYATSTLNIVQVIIHHGDNFPIFHTGR